MWVCVFSLSVSCTALNSELKFCSGLVKYLKSFVTRNDQLNQNVNHRDTEDDGMYESPYLWCGRIPFGQDNGKLLMLQKHHKALSYRDIVRDVSDLVLNVHCIPWTQLAVNNVWKHDKHSKDYSLHFGLEHLVKTIFSLISLMYFKTYFSVKNPEENSLVRWNKICYYYRINESRMFKADVFGRI